MLSTLPNEETRLIKASRLPTIITAALILMIIPSFIAGQEDYLLRKLADSSGIPPRALKPLDPLKYYHPEGPKPGLGELLDKISTTDPVFQQAYTNFLRELDNINTQMGESGCGPFRLPSQVQGMEDFTESIVAMGGVTDGRCKSNEFGMSWNKMMEKAFYFSRSALISNQLKLESEELNNLSNLLALAQIAAICNRVIPQSYREEFFTRHPEFPDVQEKAPGGINQKTWIQVKGILPWVYHVGVLPWRQPKTRFPHHFYDTFHFFSHAWMVNYSVYRNRFFPDTQTDVKVFPQPISPRFVKRELNSVIGIAFLYELASTSWKNGLADITPLEELPDNLRNMSAYLKLKGIPVWESYRDIMIDLEGARFGATLALTRKNLRPESITENNSILRQFLKK